MAYAIFNETLQDGRHAMLGASISFQRTVAKWRGPGPHRTRRVVLDDHGRRTYAWEQGLTDEQLGEWLAFMEARSWSGEAFLLRDPKEAAFRQLSLGNGTGAQTVFPMTTVASDADFPLYPRAATAYALVGAAPGVPTALASVDVDARTVTFAVAPAAVAVVLVYEPMRLVALADGVELELAMQAYSKYQLRLEEVVRD